MKKVITPKDARIYLVEQDPFGLEMLFRGDGDVYSACSMANELFPVVDELYFIVYQPEHKSTLLSLWLKKPIHGVPNWDPSIALFEIRLPDYHGEPHPLEIEEDMEDWKEHEEGPYSSKPEILISVPEIIELPENWRCREMRIYKLK